MSNREPNLPVRLSRHKRKAEDWSLALSSADIEHAVVPVGAKWAVLVAEDDLAAALGALDAYDQEQKQAAVGPPPPRDYGPTQAALWYFSALVVFFFWTEHGPAGGAWEDAGRAYSTRIRAGEWWRAITALTLHADLVHVLGNAVTGVIFGGALCRTLGPGTALWVMLLSGGGGNLINALLRGGAHAAVGASTAIFGAFGALAGLQTVRRYSFIATRRRAWMPAAAALAMLALLGAGEASDIWAHLFGLAVGFATGIAVARALGGPLQPSAEHALAAASILAVVGSWFLALK